ncbi:uncharacterized protein LOC113375092 [Ctenocephalides felis]|uniref:uncharacterized protein LOC113375092 n=1 Tax=Ctenocephalides felis TaxID=7515 RepID=UPI000E6E47D2|nr:uncharacterized protein LOC113375092 [Ctenocephalides felis]
MFAESYPGGISNMLALTWNDELALMATAWSSRCPTLYETDPCPKINDDEYFSQNLAQFVVNPGSSLRTVDELVRVWIEAPDSQYDRTSSFDQIVDPLVSSIGCAWSVFSIQPTADYAMDIQRIVCNFDHATNNSRNFSIGKPCSKCPPQKTLCMNGSLCSARKSFQAVITESHTTLEHVSERTTLLETTLPPIQTTATIPIRDITETTVTPLPVTIPSSTVSNCATTVCKIDDRGRAHGKRRKGDKARMSTVCYEFVTKLVKVSSRKTTTSLPTQPIKTTTPEAKKTVKSSDSFIPRNRTIDFPFMHKNKTANREKINITPKGSRKEILIDRKSYRRDEPYHKSSELGIWLNGICHCEKRNYKPNHNIESARNCERINNFFSGRERDSGSRAVAKPYYDGEICICSGFRMRCDLIIVFVVFITLYYI